jgi:hypothetical protein
VTVTEELIHYYAQRIGRWVGPRDTLQHWTRATKHILCDFVQDRGWQPVSTAIRNHEFLVDFLALNEQTSDIELAVETEWGTLGAILHEFRKLLYIKADVKVMMCGPAAGSAYLCSRIEEVASRYPRHTAGETYVLVDVSEADMLVRSCVWSAEADGPAEVRFQRYLENVPFAFSGAAVCV